MFLLTAGLGCHSDRGGADLSTVGAQVEARFGQTLPCDGGVSQLLLPRGESLEGLTEEEAVAIALWNNAAFQELLTDLGVARGDLIQAGLLPNPEFVYYFPNHNKPLKYLFDLPIEAFWLRPVRVKAAARETDRVAARLTQSALDLIRDARQAYADVILARERLRVAKLAVQVRGRISELAEKRLKAGDISGQEAATARIDALLARQDETRIGYEIPIAEERLRNVLGVGPLRCPITLAPAAAPSCQKFDADALVEEAMASRPDALASAEAAAAAEARLCFARVGWVRLLGIGDATSGRRSGHEFSPAFRFTVPIFNQNQGNIARAEAEWARAVRNQKTVAYQIILDVQRAHLLYQQSCAELEVLNAKVLPEVQASIRRAEKAYREGNVNYLLVLEASRQLIDSTLRAAILQTDLRRNWAELERSVGRHLDPASGPCAAPAAEQAGPETPLPRLPEPATEDKKSSGGAVPDERITP